jgi:hypothetical protein
MLDGVSRLPPFSRVNEVIQVNRTNYPGPDITVRPVETGPDLVVAPQVRAVLLRLAKVENDRAADEAANVPYWEPCPPSVSGRRAAARALTLEADALLAPRPAADRTGK